MNSGTLASELGWLGMLLLALAVAWWATRRIPKAWARWYARLLILPTLGYCWVRIDETRSERPDSVHSQSDALALIEGGWRCILCGALECRWTVGEVALIRLPWTEPSEHHDSRAFRGWYASAIGGDHAHDWQPIGCQWGSTFVCCYMDPGLTYYQSIPRLPDRAVAVAMVRKVLAAAPSDRRELVGALDEQDPFQPIASGEEMDCETFEQRYATWLAANPEWR